MHDAVEHIVDQLEENNILENTIIFFISDHGPHREYCEEGGDASIFRGKYISYSCRVVHSLDSQSKSGGCESQLDTDGLWQDINLHVLLSIQG